MPICNDPSIAYLKEYGYSVLRLPRREFRPLQILSSQGRELVPLGELSTVMVLEPDSKLRLPPIRRDVPSATISGQRTSDLSLGVGLNVIGNLIGAMGGDKLGLDASYKKARTVAFEFLDVLVDDVAIADLDQFLGASDIDPASKHVATLLEADDVYVVTATLKSKKFSVESKASSGTAVDLNVPEIQSVVGGSVKVSGTATQSSKLTFEGQSPLVFGFQAIQLYYNQGHYTAFKPLVPGETAARGLPGSRMPDGLNAFTSVAAFAPIALA